MRGCRQIALLSCLALVHTGCAEQTPAAASYTCGRMRDTAGAFRQQARLIIAREGSKTSALSSEEAVLDVELLLRNACRNAANGYKPYARIASAPPAD
jgi:hypothetical protein